ncbi:helix-turn-helix domain-containing protein [Paenibacillus sp. JNUCC31]|uniref:helix-turn-helix transcriptional regulator n=1 Tax=Paenibacillus sp. JNUCC-31 TaxID=2777983 RepID=UPI0017811BD2|nr:helix-turn-helix transcriptional regulator [Paenibacillus sp. JNUCC-31]QOS79756.1 helix-turn-helix domain-containing protein [Paenibacillus sp. JNUCC-31]
MSRGVSRNKRLGEFLKSRRSLIQPEQVGLSGSYGQRRTPGLRREEVAVLAGVSATYYTWLEQGRELAASREVMVSIANALQLTLEEKDHLFHLWDPNAEHEFLASYSQLEPGWESIIGQLTYPSFITNERSEVLAWNEAANTNLFNFSSMHVHDRLMMRILFLDTTLRERMHNWEEFARHSVAVFRTYYDKYQVDPQFTKIVKQLSEESVDFQTIWNLHQVGLKQVNRVQLETTDRTDGIVYTYDIFSMNNLNSQSGIHCCIYVPVAV